MPTGREKRRSGALVGRRSRIGVTLTFDLVIIFIEPEPTRGERNQGSVSNKKIEEIEEREGGERWMRRHTSQ